MHEDQVDVTVETVATLVGDQFPEWRHERVERLESSGTVNAIFRLGDGLTARFPLRLADAAEERARLAREERAGAELARVSPFPVPEPVALGEPGAGYPMPWSVQTWLPGTVATEADPGASPAFAEDLAVFVGALRAAPTHGRRFDGRGRGGDLTGQDAWLERCFTESEGLLDVPRLRRLWRRLRELPREKDDVMSHGDLIAGNVLVSGDRLCGVLDGGGFAPADPALDVAAAWFLLEPGPRGIFRRALDCDDLDWERGRAWAVAQAMGAVWYYARTNPTMSTTAHRTLDRVLEAEISR